MSALGVKAWSGNAVVRARRQVVELGWVPGRCGVCQGAVSLDESWVIGHKKSRRAYPELTWEMSNWQIEHRKCSDAGGQRAVIEAAERRGREGGSSSPRGGRRELQGLPAHTLGATGGTLEVPEHLTWTHVTKRAPSWLKPFLDVPGEASPPLAMTPVHPEATGSYGPDALAWMEANLKGDDGKPLRLRWWQRLAIVRQLERREDGTLCWRNVIESAPRRAGKSVRLRSIALWRLESADLFGEVQTVVHTGKDLQIVREVMKKSWRWALAREGWDVRRGAGQEEVSTDEGESRWLVRAQDACYGYDLCLGLVDESWGVPAVVIEEALEPAMLERSSPQLLMTTTSHRRATPLMKRRISNALATEDGETLLLLWGARPQDDPSDEATWRAASPYWSEDRRRVIASKYAAALAGEADPEADEPDPMQGFLNQYLNVWDLRAARVAAGDPVTTEDEWAALAGDAPDRTPDSVAVEGWFEEGVSVAQAWLDGRRATVSVTDHEDLEDAASFVRSLGFRGTVTVGASLAKDPALKGVRVKAGEGRTAQACQELRRLLGEDGLRHDGEEHLTGQLLAVRTRPSSDGPRVVSKSRADAVKAAVWAVTSARRPGIGKPRVVFAP